MPIGAARMMMGKQATSSSFDPLTAITWKVAYWVEGPNFVAQSYGADADVGTWPDEVGSADATQATASRKPQYRTSYTNWNNKPAVEWTPTGDPGDLLKTSTAAFTLTYPITHVSLVVPTTMAFSNRPITDADGARNSIFVNSTPNFGMYNGQSSGAGTTTVTANTKYLLEAHFIGSLSQTDTLRLNGATEKTQASYSSKIDDFAIGGYPTSNYRGFVGAIVFSAIYEGNFSTDGEYANFKTWCNDHYGMSI